MRCEFSEVLNDLIDYFLVGDIVLLKHYKEQNDLTDDLASEFVSNDSGEKAVRSGVVVPLAGIENHPYTIIFNLSEETPELLKAESRLQHRRGGYVLRVEHRSVMLFTWRILSNFTDEALQRLLARYQELGRPVVELENGWYELEILGGEVLRNGWFEPAFEFVLRKVNEPGDTSLVDISYRFSIQSNS